MIDDERVVGGVGHTWNRDISVYPLYPFICRAKCATTVFTVVLDVKDSTYLLFKKLRMSTE